MNEQLEAEKLKQLEASRGHGKSASGGDGKNKKPWSEEEMQLLIKAVNLFPAGTVARSAFLKFQNLKV